jgi:hypothetical protein
MPLFQVEQGNPGNIHRFGIPRGEESPLDPRVSLQPLYVLSSSSSGNINFLSGANHIEVLYPHNEHKANTSESTSVASNPITDFSRAPNRRNRCLYLKVLKYYNISIEDYRLK